MALALTDLACASLYRALSGESFYDRVDPERALNRRYRIRSSLYHHDLRPNVDVDASWRAPYRIATNSLGFKDKAIRQVSLRASGPRLLFIGDSFTEGIGVPYPETFVGRLDAHFASLGVEVLNAGVASYSPVIYYRKLRYLLEEVGLQVSQVIVFLDVSDPKDEAEDYELDARGNVATRRLELGALHEFLQEHSILYSVSRFIKLQWRAAAPAAAANPLNASIDDPRSLWTVNEASFRSYGERGLQAMQENMDRLARLLAAHGVGLTIVVYPWPTQIAHKDRDSLQARVWRDWAARHEARFIDLFPAFVSADDDVNRQTIRDLFIADDFHWNASGHRRVAERFLEHFSLDGVQE